MCDLKLPVQRTRLEMLAGSQGPWSASAAKPKNVPIRSLGCCERFFHLYSLAFPVHFCLVARVEGALDSARLGAALEQVRRRHPALRVSIVDDAENGPAFCRTDNSIKVCAVPVEAEADWRGVVESELNLPFDTVPGPLMRATALWRLDGASIILTFHHAMADALSGTRILDDLMRALAGEHLRALSPLPPIEEMIARAVSNPALALDGATRADISSKAPERVAQAPDKFTANISIFEWDQKETARLVQRCKANGTTVHGAICAAAARHLPASDDKTIRMHCPIDLSRIAGIESGHCGVFIGAGTVEIPAMRRRPLWLDARDIVDRLRAARSPVAVARMLQWIAAELPPAARKDQVREFFASQPQSSAVISNLGVLPLAVDYGPLALKAVWGPAMLTNLPADRQTIGVSTFAGRLRMIHQSYQPIAGLLEAIRGTLLTSCA
jgi:Condensation domain